MNGDRSSCGSESRLTTKKYLQVSVGTTAVTTNKESNPRTLHTNRRCSLGRWHTVLGCTVGIAVVSVLLVGARSVSPGDRKGFHLRVVR